MLKLDVVSYNPRLQTKLFWDWERFNFVNSTIRIVKQFMENSFAETLSISGYTCFGA